MKYIQRFNSAALEVLASELAQGLLDGDIFKSLAKKAAINFDNLVARAEKYVNMEEAQQMKRGETNDQKKDRRKDGGPGKRIRPEYREKFPSATPRYA